MCCIVLNASHVFVYCSFLAPVDAFADILKRDVVSEIPVLVHLLTMSASLFVITACILTTIVATSVLSSIIDG